MKVPRVELYQRRFMNSAAFLHCVRKRICMPRGFFIPFAHRCAVTGYCRAEKPKQRA